MIYLMYYHDTNVCVCVCDKLYILNKHFKQTNILI